MRRLKTPPALVGALGLLGADWQAALRRLARLVRPSLGRLERRFLQELRVLGLDPTQLRALRAVTPGAAATLLCERRSVAAFLEQVDYNGRRLAKLNLPPSTVLGVLSRYNRRLAAELRQLAPQETEVLLPACRQLDACVAITLNNAFYQVREAETTAFFELGRAELESRDEAQLLARSERVLRRYCQARAARILFADGRATLPRLRSRPRYLDLERCPKELLLEPGWRGRYRAAWSVPLPAQAGPAGIMQFAFAKEYRWLPREIQLLEAAGESCRLACVKARLVEELAAREQQVRALAGHMLQVEEAERRRISRELHDEAGQLLLYLRLHLERLEGVVSSESPEVAAGLAGARQLLEQTIVEIRRLLADLSPAVLEQLGLEAAVRQLVTRFRRLYSLPVDLRLSRLGRLPSGIETVVYRLVQECLSNVARHSSARAVMVSLTRDDRSLGLQVQDDGVGFDVEEALARPGSFGLAGVRERVALVGGACAITSRPGRGCTVSIELPIPPPERPGKRPRRGHGSAAGRRARRSVPRG